MGKTPDRGYRQPNRREIEIGIPVRVDFENIKGTL
jgi:hypothetical protein